MSTIIPRYRDRQALRRHTATCILCPEPAAGTSRGIRYEGFPEHPNFMIKPPYCTTHLRQVTDDPGRIATPHGWLPWPAAPRHSAGSDGPCSVCREPALDQHPDTGDLLCSLCRDEVDAEREYTADPDWAHDQAMLDRDDIFGVPA